MALAVEQDVKFFVGVKSLYLKSCQLPVSTPPAVRFLIRVIPLCHSPIFVIKLEE